MKNWQKQTNIMEHKLLIFSEGAIISSIDQLGYVFVLSYNSVTIFFCLSHENILYILIHNQIFCNNFHFALRIFILFCLSFNFLSINFVYKAFPFIWRCFFWELVFFSSSFCVFSENLCSFCVFGVTCIKNVLLGRF